MNDETRATTNYDIELVEVFEMDRTFKLRISTQERNQHVAYVWYEPETPSPYEVAKIERSARLHHSRVDKLKAAIREAITLEWLPDDDTLSDVFAHTEAIGIRF